MIHFPPESEAKEFCSHNWYYLAMIEKADNPAQRRRPGPIAFNAEQHVTKLNLGDAPNPGGIGSATPPSLETPKGSRELKVKGPIFWFLIGALLIVLGVFSSLVLLAAGVVVCVAAMLGNRMNKTNRRLRQPIREADTSKDVGNSG